MRKPILCGAGGSTGLAQPPPPRILPAMCWRAWPTAKAAGRS